MAYPQAITIPYDVNKKAFDTRQIELLGVRETRKDDVKQLFLNLQKNDGYQQLSSSFCFKLLILLLVVIFLLSAVFVAGTAYHAKEGHHDNDDLYYDDYHDDDHYYDDYHHDDYTEEHDYDYKDDHHPDDHLPEPDHKQEENHTKGTDSPDSDHIPHHGDPDYQEVSESIETDKADRRHGYRDNKKAFIFFLVVLIILCTVMVFLIIMLCYIQRKRKNKYNELSKHELEVISHFFILLGDGFKIEKQHKRKKIFKCCSCFHSYDFSFTVVSHGDEEDLLLREREGTLEEDEQEFEKNDYRVYDTQGTHELDSPENNKD